MVFNILITGGTGFVGSSLLHYLLSRPVDEIGEDVKLHYTYQTQKPFLNFNADSYFLDVTDKHSVDTLIGSIRPRAVVHLAAVSNSTLCNKDHEHSFAVNVNGTANVLEAVSKLCNDCRFIFLSSDLVYPDGDGSYKESSRFAGNNGCYSLTKIAAERIIFNSGYRNCVVFRGAFFYGPDSPNGARSNLDWMITGMRTFPQSRKKITVFRDEWRSPIYIKDALYCIWRAMVIERLESDEECIEVENKSAIVTESQEIDEEKMDGRKNAVEETEVEEKQCDGNSSTFVSNCWSGRSSREWPLFFNLGGPERLTREHCAQKIATVLKLDPAAINAILVKESGLVRPLDVTMDTSRLSTVLGVQLLSFEEGITACKF